MPGYRPISSAVTGAAADSARAAALLTKTGDSTGAVRLLEEALAASMATRPEMPGWLCGRLAVLYRTLGRLEDEVHLLERYHDTQTSDDARTRYEARLSKARTLLARKRPQNNGALSSVRRAIEAPRRLRVIRVDRDATTDPALPAAHLERLTELFARRSEKAFDAAVEEVLTGYVAEARANGIPLEVLVEGLREAAKAATATSHAKSTSAERFSAALVGLLALYFDEP
jgi:hypothetical protein